MASTLMLLVLLLLTPFLASGSPQCVNENGEPVDWFIVYKFPQLSTENAQIFGGFQYAVLTSAAPDGWHLSAHNITQRQHSIFAETLAPVFGPDGRRLYSLFYSDQPPGDESVSSTYAHSKGLLVADEKQGFWLIHTVPRFTPGARYGQVAMCISLATSQLAKVVQQNFLTAKVYPYHVSITNSSSPIGIALNKVKNKQWTSGDGFVETKLTSLGGTPFRSFYKSPGDQVDLYAAIVAPAVHSPLLVETWRRNPGSPLESACSLPKTKVENVAQVKLSFVNSEASGSFKYSLDHSKWAISGKKSNSTLVCIGDINRMESQFKRGGGTTCISVPSVWRAFQSFVGDVERCGGT